MSQSPASTVTAVILAAGRGTRMKSTRPKVLFPVLGKPLVSWVVDAVAAKVALCAWAGRRRVGEMRKGILYG